jgi:parallel beta-helix repeat protein
VLEDCAVYDNARCGLAAETSSTPAVRNCRINRNAAAGLCLTGAAGGTVQGCDLRHNAAGAWASPPPDGVVRQNNQE